MSESPTVSDPRLVALRTWLGPLGTRYGLEPDTLRPVSEDASFRRYFRLNASHSSARHARRDSLVVMDAPPPQEDCHSFVHAARVFGLAGVNVPAGLETELMQGFLLLEDFGDTTYLERLDAASAPALYRDASVALIRLQAAGPVDAFPRYDRALLERELMLYPDWYLARHKGVSIDDETRVTLADTFETLLSNALAQPTVQVHRDYHARNLMRLEGDGNPGVLDFQDAVHGPITYDLVSLLRDAYLCWDEELVLDQAIRHWERARAAALPVPADFGAFWRDFEWMGLQRHLKVLGIFARLHHRDGKSRYPAELPRVLGNVRKVTERYVAFTPLRRLIERIEDE
jgi:aminoglycoside/choline kinase family phosphotransferase